MKREKVRRPLITLLVAVPLAEPYSAILKWLDRPMDNAWMVNTFFLISQSLLIYYFCREEKKAEIVQAAVVPEKPVSRNLFRRFWSWLKSLIKKFAAWFNRFIEKLHAKNLFWGNIAMFLMAIFYFRLATMTFGLKREPWKFLPGFVPGFVIKLFIVQKTGEGAASAAEWLWSGIVVLTHWIMSLW